MRSGLSRVGGSTYEDRTRGLLLTAYPDSGHGRTLKIELVYRNSWRTREESENAIFAYIDGWYNTHRIQKELGYLSPGEYETAHIQTHINREDSQEMTPAPTGGR